MYYINPFIIKILYLSILIRLFMIHNKDITLLLLFYLNSVLIRSSFFKILDKNLVKESFLI